MWNVLKVSLNWFYFSLISGVVLCLVYQLLVVGPHLYTFSFCRLVAVVGVGWGWGTIGSCHLHLQWGNNHRKLFEGRPRSLIHYWLDVWAEHECVSYSKNHHVINRQALVISFRSDYRNIFQLGCAVYPFPMLSTFNNQQARYRSTTNQKQPDPPSRAVIGLKHNRQRVLYVLMIGPKHGRRQRIAVASQSGGEGFRALGAF